MKSCGCYVVVQTKMQMDILGRVATTNGLTHYYLRSTASSSLLVLKPSCSRGDPQQNNDNNNNNNNNNNNKGERFSTDWDKAWSNFRKQGKKTLFSQFSPNKYVTWNPRRSNYPLSEEVDPIKRTERSNLMLWTSPRFTLVLAILIVTFLLLYTILAPMK